MYIMYTCLYITHSKQDLSWQIMYNKQDLYWQSVDNDVYMLKIVHLKL